MLIGGGEIVEFLELYRFCWITGRPAGGKTSFAVRIAREFLERGYRLASNLKCVWNDDLASIGLNKDGMLKVVVIMDEAGLQLQSSKQVKRVFSFSAKMDMIILIPSHSEPPRAAQIVTIQPVFSFISIGLPIIVYTYEVNCGRFKTKGFFLWIAPKEVFGVYSRQFTSYGVEKIINWCNEKTKEFVTSQGGDFVPEVDDSKFAWVESFSEAGNALEDAVDELSVSVRKAGRKKI
jgi:hypothetical protein